MPPICRPRTRSAPWPTAGSPTPTRPSGRAPSWPSAGELPARRHRHCLDPDHPLAGPARLRAGPAAAREGHRGDGGPARPTPPRPTCSPPGWRWPCAARPKRIKAAGPLRAGRAFGGAEPPAADRSPWSGPRHHRRTDDGPPAGAVRSRCPGGRCASVWPRNCAGWTTTRSTAEVLAKGLPLVNASPRSVRPGRPAPVPRPPAAARRRPWPVPAPRPAQDGPEGGDQGRDQAATKPAAKTGARATRSSAAAKTAPTTGPESAPATARAPRRRKARRRPPPRRRSRRPSRSCPVRATRRMRHERGAGSRHPRNPTCWRPPPRPGWSPSWSTSSPPPIPVVALTGGGVGISTLAHLNDSPARERRRLVHGWRSCGVTNVSCGRRIRNATPGRRWTRC